MLALFHLMAHHSDCSPCLEDHFSMVIIKMGQITKIQEWKAGNIELGHINYMSTGIKTQTVYKNIYINIDKTDNGNDRNLSWGAVRLVWQVRPFFSQVGLWEQTSAVLVPYTSRSQICLQYSTATMISIGQTFYVSGAFAESRVMWGCIHTRTQERGFHPTKKDLFHSVFCYKLLLVLMVLLWETFKRILEESWGFSWKIKYPDQKNHWLRKNRCFASRRAWTGLNALSHATATNEKSMWTLLTEYENWTKHPSCSK